jgi:putative inorganic carbon (HCO3(-)) transporter
LFLVAALQGGILVQLSLGDAPVSTLMPFLGGWTLLAVLIDRRPGSRSLVISHHGRWLMPSLIALAVVVALTGLAQVWRPGGRILGPVEVLTLVQLGVLVALSGYLLSTPKRVMMMAYVTIASGALVAVVALAEQAGLLTLGALTTGAGYTRASGLLEDPNYFSLQLLIALAFAIHVAVAARSTLWRVVTWLASALITAGIISSYSAGALVGVGALAGTTIVLQYKVSVKRALVALAIMAAVAVVVAVTAPPEYREAVGAKFSGLAGSSFEELGTKRGAAWQAGANEFVHNPVLGTGLSTENEARAIAEYYRLYTTDRRVAHNTYIAMAVTTGVFGLAAFLLIMGSCFSVLWRAHSRAADSGDSEAALAAAGALTALVVIATQSLQLDTQLVKYTWLIIGACLGVRRWNLGKEAER